MTTFYGLIQLFKCKRFFSPVLSLPRLLLTVWTCIKFCQNSLHLVHPAHHSDSSITIPTLLSENLGKPNLLFRWVFYPTWMKSWLKLPITFFMNVTWIVNEFKNTFEVCVNYKIFLLFKLEISFKITKFLKSWKLWFPAKTCKFRKFPPIVPKYLYSFHLISFLWLGWAPVWSW